MGGMECKGPSAERILALLPWQPHCFFPMLKMQHTAGDCLHADFPSPSISHPIAAVDPPPPYIYMYGFNPLN